MNWFVDFTCIAGGYTRTISVRGVDSSEPSVVLNIAPPTNWNDIVFKQMNRSLYYADSHYLDWCDGDVQYDDWLSTLLQYISLSDNIYVNNYSKAVMLDMCGFKNLFVEKVA